MAIRVYKRDRAGVKATKLVNRVVVDVKVPFFTLPYANRKPTRAFTIEHFARLAWHGGAICGLRAGYSFQLDVDRDSGYLMLALCFHFSFLAIGIPTNQSAL